MRHVRHDTIAQTPPHPNRTTRTRVYSGRTSKEDAVGYGQVTVADHVLTSSGCGLGPALTGASAGPNGAAATFMASWRRGSIIMLRCSGQTRFCATREQREDSSAESSSFSFEVAVVVRRIFICWQLS